MKNKVVEILTQLDALAAQIAEVGERLAGCVENREPSDRNDLKLAFELANKCDNLAMELPAVRLADAICELGEYIGDSPQRDSGNTDQEWGDHVAAYWRRAEVAAREFDIALNAWRETQGFIPRMHRLLNQAQSIQKLLDKLDALCLNSHPAIFQNIQSLAQNIRKGLDNDLKGDA